MNFCKEFCKPKHTSTRNGVNWLLLFLCVQCTLVSNFSVTFQEIWFTFLPFYCLASYNMEAFALILVLLTFFQNLCLLFVFVFLKLRYLSWQSENVSVVLCKAVCLKGTTGDFAATLCCLIINISVWNILFSQN